MTPSQCRFLDPVWDEFEETENDEFVKCKRCPASKGILKVNKGSKTGLVGHIKMHEKQDERGNKEGIKAWLLACMVTLLNIPFRVFQHPVMRILFKLAKLSPVNDKIARHYTDLEAE